MKKLLFGFSSIYSETTGEHFTSHIRNFMGGMSLLPIKLKIFVNFVKDKYHVIKITFIDFYFGIIYWITFGPCIVYFKKFQGI